MLTEIYIEALLIDPEQADAIWQLWLDGLIDDDLAKMACQITTA